VKFFAKLFYKKAGFWLLFSKSNITYKDFLILFLKKFSLAKISIDKDSVYIE